MFVQIQGSKLVLTQKMYEVMPFFKADESISGHKTVFTLPSNIVSVSIWEKILNLLSIYHFQLPGKCKIKSNSRDTFDKQFISFIQQMSLAQINKLYKAAHFLQIDAIRNLISSYFACEVYIEDMKKNYKLLAEKMEVTTQIQTSLILSYKANEPTLN